MPLNVSFLRKLRHVQYKIVIVLFLSLTLFLSLLAPLFSLRHAFPHSYHQSISQKDDNNIPIVLAPNTLIVFLLGIGILELVSTQTTLSAEDRKNCILIFIRKYYYRYIFLHNASYVLTLWSWKWKHIILLPIFTESARSKLD